MTFSISLQSEPSVVTVTNTLLDISARASNGSQTEENLDSIGRSLNNLANIIEVENIIIDETVRTLLVTRTDIVIDV